MQRGRTALACLCLTVLAGAACSSRPSVASPPPSAPAATSASASGAAASRFPANLVLSVLYFDDRTGQSDLAWLRKGMADMLVAELARMPSVMVMQRDRMEEVFREQAFQLSGRVADESVVRVGRIAGATVIVTGSVSVADGKLRIDAQLQGVEQGTILGTASAEGKLTEVSATARALVGKVVELLPHGNERRLTVEQDDSQGQGQGMVQAAKANDAGEMLSRQGKLFQALEEFERAVAADPMNPSARSNYSQAVRNLSGADLLRFSQAGSREQDRQLVARVVERLAGQGMEATIGAAQADLAVGGAMTVRVPITIRLSASALEAARESARVLGGRSDRAPAVPGGSGEALDLVLASRPELNREFTRQLGTPRRLYLRLLATDGRTIALFSGWRDWQLARWVAPVDDQHVQIRPDYVLAAEATFSGLTPEQVAGVAGARLTVEPASHERNLLRLEAVEEEPAAAHQPPLQWGGRVQSDAAPDLQGLRSELEQVWNPPVTERGWGRGYLPSNERTAVILAIVEPGAGLKGDPRVSKPSGDKDFDQAALAATRQAVQRWMATNPFVVRSPATAPGSGDQAHPVKESRSVKIRAHFRILKDVPSLNLLGALAHLDPVPLTGVSPLAAPASR